MTRQPSTSALEINLSSKLVDPLYRYAVLITVTPSLAVLDSRITSHTSATLDHRGVVSQAHGAGPQHVSTRLNRQRPLRLRALLVLPPRASATLVSCTSLRLAACNAHPGSKYTWQICSSTCVQMRYCPLSIASRSVAALPSRVCVKRRKSSSLTTLAEGFFNHSSPPSQPPAVQTGLAETFQG